jgi:hypothetical protein
VAGRYVDVSQPYVDAKVESHLCVGGPIAYKLIADSGCNIDWLYASVVPGIVAHFGRQNSICEILGLALLWTCHEESEQYRVPPLLLQQVRDAYRSVKTEGSPPNLVQRVCLTVYALQETLCINEVVPLLAEDGTQIQQQIGRQGVVGVVNGVTQEQLTGLMMQVQ